MFKVHRASEQASALICWSASSRNVEPSECGWNRPRDRPSGGWMPRLLIRLTETIFMANWICKRDNPLGDDMNLAAGLHDALMARKPAIAQSYVDMVTRLHARMVAGHGPALRGVANSWEHAKTYRACVAPFLSPVSGNRSIRGEVPRVLDLGKLQAAAECHARDVVLAWEDKITAKMGAVENPHIRQIDAATFRIGGALGGRNVRIEQTMILNVSSAGKLFNQFPARIYVDGKFTSEAAYKRLAA